MEFFLCHRGDRVWRNSRFPRYCSPAPLNIAGMMMDTLSWQAQAHLEKIKAHFDQSATLSPQAISYRRLLARYFNLLIPADASVLEVGCGTGELLASIKAKSKTGIDLSEDQISRARQRVH